MQKGVEISYIKGKGGGKLVNQTPAVLKFVIKKTEARIQINLWWQVTVNASKKNVLRITFMQKWGRVWAGLMPAI